jgi:hypothetical protein
MTILDEIARAGGHATPQSRSRPDRGPVFAYVPSERSLRLAMDLARGYSLVAVEGSNFRLAEWAAGADAVNVLTEEATSSGIPDDVLHDLDSVVSCGGRNGWTGADEKNHVRRHLVSHIQTGRLTPDQAASYMMSQGVSDRGAKRLRELSTGNCAVGADSEGSPEIRGAETKNPEIQGTDPNVAASLSRRHAFQPEGASG